MRQEPSTQRAGSGRNSVPLIVGITAMVLLGMVVVWLLWPTDSPPLSIPSDAPSPPAGLMAESVVIPAAGESGRAMEQGLAPNEVRRYLGHQGQVWSLAFSPDGKRFVSVGEDRTVRLWDVASGKALWVHTYSGKPSRIRAVAFSPDGKRILIGPYDGIPRLIDAARGVELAELTGHTAIISAVAISADGHRALTGAGYWGSGGDYTMRLWDLETYKELRRFEGHVSGVHSVAFSPDGKQAATGSFDRTIKLWDLETGRNLRTIAEHAASVKNVAYLPDGKRLLSGSSDRTLRLWDLSTGRMIRLFEGHTDMLESLMISPDGQRAVSAAVDGTVRLWDIERGVELCSFSVKPGDRTSPAIFTADGRSILSGNSDGSIHLWRIPDAFPAPVSVPGKMLLGHQIFVAWVSFSPDGKLAVSSGGGNDRSIRLWDLASGKQIQQFDDHRGEILCVRFTPDGKRLLSCDTSGRLCLRDWATGQVSLDVGGTGGNVIANLLGRSGPAAPNLGFSALAIAPDGQSAFVGGQNGLLHLWNLTTGKEIAQYAGHQGPVQYACLSKDGGKLLSASSDRTVRLWDLKTGKVIRQFPSDGAEMCLAVFSLDEKLILSGDASGGLILWSAATGQVVRRFLGHTAAMSGAAFLPDGRRILTANADRSVRIWDLDSGSELKRVQLPNSIRWMDLSPDGGRLVIGHSLGAVRVMDVP